MKAIINANIVLHDTILENGILLHENGRIEAVYPQGHELPEVSQSYDANGLFLGPGFVDIHCHAGGDTWAHEDPAAMAAFHLAGGTTTLNCTIFHDIGIEGALQAMEKIRTAIEAKTPGNILGVHFEGPFLNPKYGANAKTIRPVDRDEYRLYLDKFKDILKMWTISPEIPGAREFIKEVAKEGIVLAMGHSEASPEDVFWAAENGVTVCTHLFDATGCHISPTRWAGTVECCFDSAAMLCDNVFCELIVDKDGVHIRPEMLRLALKTIGLGRAVAITDACTGSVDGSDINMVGGELYGSKLRMNRAARNLKNTAGLSLPEVFQICAANPARAIKAPDVGTIEAGQRANFVITDENFNIKATILEGNTVFF